VVWIDFSSAQLASLSDLTPWFEMEMESGVLYFIVELV
jgi:hypothetical protein